MVRFSELDFFLILSEFQSKLLGYWYSCFGLACVYLEQATQEPSLFDIIRKYRSIFVISFNDRAREFTDILDNPQ